jgi:hypothetical protein
MPERNEDHSRVAVPVTPAPTRGVHKQLDFLDSEIFAWPTRSIRYPAWRYCPIYSYWALVAAYAYN